MTMKALKSCLTTLALIALLFLYRCSSHSKESGSSSVPSISITENQYLRNPVASDIFEWVDLTLLETNPELLCGPVVEFVYSGDRYYLRDKFNEICVFDKNGFYHHKISRTGSGPGEYTQIGNMVVDPDSKSILINNNEKGKVIRYDSTGQFISEFKTESNQIRLGAGPGNQIATMNVYTDYLLYLMNKDGIIEQKLFLFDPRFFILVPNNPFYRYNDNLLFWMDLNDTVYKISSRSCVPHLYIDFGESRISRDEYLSQAVESRQGGPKRPPLKYRYGITDFKETDSLIVFRFLHGEENRRFFFQAIFSKTDHSGIYYRADLKDDILFNPIFAPIRDLDQNEFIFLIDAVNLCENTDRIISSGHINNKAMIVKLKLVKENDNPVVIRARRHISPDHSIILLQSKIDYILRDHEFTETNPALRYRIPNRPPETSAGAVSTGFPPDQDIVN